MKWAIANGVAATKYYRLGWAKALTIMGEDVGIWDIENKPANDLFYEQQFDILMIGTWQLTPAIVKNIIERNTKVFLWAPNWGDGDKEIDRKNPLDNVQLTSEGEILLAEQLVKGGTTHCISYYCQKYLDYTHGYWKNIGLTPIGLPLAADILSFPITKPDPNFASDWAFIGGRWPAKAGCLDPYLLPLCHPSTGLSGKIFGSGHWPVHQHLGFLEDALVPKVLASAKICPCIFEPISLMHGYDCSERIYKVMAVGGFAISQSVKTCMEDLFTDNEAVWCSTPQEFHQAVLYFAKNPQERIPYIERGVKTVYSKHTYYDRASSLFDAWNMPEQKNLCIKTKNSMLTTLSERAKEFNEKLSSCIKEGIVNDTNL